MGKISNITLPDGNKYDVRAAAIPYGEVDSSSTATAFTVTVPGITELTDGTICYIKNGVVTSASGFTINVNSLGAKPVYSSMDAASRSTTIFNINYTMMFIYNEDRVSGGCWDCFYGYDSNTVDVYITVTGYNSDDQTFDTITITSGQSAEDIFSAAYNKEDITIFVDGIGSFIKVFKLVECPEVSTDGSAVFKTNDLFLTLRKLSLASSYFWHFLREFYNADEVIYDNSTSGLAAEQVQDAIDQILDLIPQNVGDLYNDAGYISAETDPTVPAWAKAASKPTYTYSEVGALSAATSIPTEATVSAWGFTKNEGTVTGVKMNGTTLAPTSGVVDIGTVLSSYTETDPTVPAWAKASTKPAYTYSEVGALSAATAIPDAVSFSQILSSGASIATITIGSTSTTVFAPEGGGNTTFRRWS